MKNGDRINALIDEHGLDRTISKLRDEFWDSNNRGAFVAAMVKYEMLEACLSMKDLRDSIPRQTVKSMEIMGTITI